MRDVPVRHSEVKDFLRCRQLWHYRWVEGLRPKSFDRQRALNVGTVMHKFLQEWYLGLKERQEGAGKPFDVVLSAALKQARNMFEQLGGTDEDAWDLIRQIAQHYVQVYGERDLWSWRVVAVEQPFYTMHGALQVPYSGTIDLIVEDLDGLLWVVDHKFTNNLDTYEQVAPYDRQITRYLWAVQQMYPNRQVAGFIYNLIAKAAPQKPKVLKNGQLSKDMRIKTTYEVYLQAIKEHGLNPDDYAEILEHLQMQRNPFFRRVEVHRTQQEIEVAMEELTLIVEDMDGASVYRNYTKDCRWDCPYVGLCQVEAFGDDGSHYRAEHFTVEGEMQEVENNPF